MAARNRRIHNFGQQNRLPSIEVYSTSPTAYDADERRYNNVINGTSSSTHTGRNSPRGIRTSARNTAAAAAKQTLSTTATTTTPTSDFRILTSTLTPSHGRSVYSSQGRMSNSKSTGNLSVEGTNDQNSMQSQPVHHASSYGRLTTHTGAHHNSSNSPSPVNSARHNNIRHSRSPNRFIRMQSAQNSRLVQGGRDSPFESFDEVNTGDDDLDDYPVVAQETKQLPSMTFNSEPITLLGHVIKPVTHEASNRKVEIRYSARNDKYKRPTHPNRLKINGWSSLVYAERNMEWVTEHCHIGDDEEIMTYLSRKPGATNGYIEWRFDFTECGLRIKRISLKFPFETFEDGHVRAYLKSDSDEVPIYTSLSPQPISQPVYGWEKFSLIAELSCQREVCSFQHAQLFRQTLKAGFFDKQEEKYQFRIEIELYSKY